MGAGAGGVGGARHVELPDDGERMSAERQYMRAILAHPLLSAAEETALATAARAGDMAARDRLITCNLRLAASIAYRFQPGPLALMDLVQEANIGLMRAVERYDPARGTRFSTHATWWIRQSIQRAIEHQGAAIRLPSYRHTELARLRRAVAVLADGGADYPTDAALAEHLGMPVARVRELRAVAWQADVTSLDRPADPRGRDTGGLRQFAETVGDRVPDERATEAIAAGIAEQERAAEVERLFRVAYLGQRERLVMRARHGLGEEDGEGQTLEAIAARLGVTRERVRQIEGRALRKLRAAAGVTQANQGEQRAS